MEERWYLELVFSYLAVVEVINMFLGSTAKSFLDVIGPFLGDTNFYKWSLEVFIGFSNILIAFLAIGLVGPSNLN